jgi:hypothetical protein
MKSKIFMGLAAIAMVAFLSSCAKVLQADIYVPAEFAAVQDSMKAIMTEVEVIESKLFKNFKEVEAKLDLALTAAQTVQTSAVAKKEEVKKEVETMMTDIKTVVEENKKLFVRAPRGKEGAAVLEQMKTEMATIETSVTEAQGMYDNGAYMDAYNKVKAAKENADKINNDLKEAIKKVGGRI